MNKKTRRATGWRNIQANAFEAFLGVVGPLAALSYAIIPEDFSQQAVHQAFGSWAYAWLGVYALAGALIVVGLWRSAKLEAAGLVLFATAAIISAIAAVATFGLEVTHIGLATNLAFITACMARLKFIFSGSALLTIRAPEGRNE